MFRDFSITILTIAFFATFVCKSHAALVGVDWDQDGVADGLGTGTLGSLDVSLISTDGSLNGGLTIPADWTNHDGSDDVPGIAGLAGANRNVIDWNSGEAGTAAITFSGGFISDPILLFDFTDPATQLDFDDSYSIVPLDQSPLASTTIGPNNVISLDSTHDNRPSDGFAIQLEGEFVTISFATNISQQPVQSFGFTVATAVPEPSAFLGLTLLTAFLVVRHRRIP